MTKKFGFHNLEIYNLSKALVLECYQITKCFPESERYALTQQMNRAAVSVPSNIAEGYSRDTAKDKAHFINIAYGSLMELVCQFEVSLDLGYITNEQLDHVNAKTYDLAIKISNFRTYIETGKPST